jgi:serine/threonine-protein kinase RsbW
VIVHTAAQLGFDNDDLNKIELCVDEACANVVDHAYPEPPEAGLPLILRIEADPRQLRISVIDRGIGGPEDKPHSGVKDLEEYLELRRNRGLGTYIMRRFMDQVEFSHAPGEGTCVSMTKYRATPNANLGAG